MRSEPKTNIAFVAFLAGIVLILSELSWWAGVIPFWLFAVMLAVCVLQYCFAGLINIFTVLATFVVGLGRGGWTPFRLQLIQLIASIFKLAEAAFDAFVMWQLWNYFYQ